MTWLVQSVHWVLRISTLSGRGRARVGASLSEAAAPGRQSWDRRFISETLARAEGARSAGQSSAELAEQLGVPRTPSGYWRARTAGLEGSPKGADFFKRPEGLAILHPISVAAHFVIGFTPRSGVRGGVIFLNAQAYRGLWQALMALNNGSLRK
jgi:hypothetical protein